LVTEVACGAFEDVTELTVAGEVTHQRRRTTKQRDQAVEVPMVRRKVRDEAEAVALIEEARRNGVRPSKVATERGSCARP